MRISTNPAGYVRVDRVPSADPELDLAMVVIQMVTTRWTKASRGAPAASERASTPEIVDLPTQVDGCKVLFHAVRFEESNGFRPVAACWESASPEYRPNTHSIDLGEGWVDVGDLPVIAHGLRISRVGELVEVEGLPATSGGWPNRYPKTILRVGPQAWGQVIRNRRESGYRGWWYWKTVTNVANAVTGLAGAFDGAPTKRVDESEDLA